MKPRWVKGLSEEDTKHVEVEFKQSPYLIERLVQLLEEDVQKSLKRMRGAASKGSPNLSELYADELATQRTLTEVIDLLT